MEDESMIATTTSAPEAATGKRKEKIAGLVSKHKEKAKAKIAAGADTSAVVGRMREMAGNAESAGRERRHRSMTRAANQIEREGRAPMREGIRDKQEALRETRAAKASAAIQTQQRINELYAKRGEGTPSAESRQQFKSERSSLREEREGLRGEARGAHNQIRALQAQLRGMRG